MCFYSSVSQPQKWCIYDEVAPLSERDLATASVLITSEAPRKVKQSSARVAVFTRLKLPTFFLFVWSLVSFYSSKEN